MSLNYSNKSFGILTVLIDESNKRSANKGTTEKLALGACIRKLTVHTDPEWITRRHNVELSQEFNALSQNEKTRRMVDACDMFFGSYMAFIEKILAHRTVLPYLELFDCEDRVNLRVCAPNITIPIFESIYSTCIEETKSMLFIEGFRVYF